jgi:beta-fructofuranosidase
MNDPNGLIQWKGRVHLFYQHNPNGPFWGTIHWGHAVSGDLVHWTDLPIALSPTPGGPDEGGCWSGCAVDDDGIPTLIYTGVHPERPCLATSADGLLTWEKYAGNPVIAAPPEDLDVVGFRDNSVWREGDTWYQVIGSGIHGLGGAALLYRSPDLVHWEYLNPILVGDEDQAGPIWTGTMWECPDFFSLGDRHVLVVSAHERRPLYTVYFVGTYADHRFPPKVLGKLDFGDTLFYAPQTFLDDKGRRIMFGWINEGRSDEAQRAAGWAGVMSLPRVLSLRPDGLLGAEPVPEVEVLRGEHYRLTGIVLAPASSGALEDVRGACLEIVAEFEPGDAKQVGVKVRCSPDGEEQTCIVYDRLARRLVLNRERSSLSPEVDRGVYEGPLDLADGERLRLHVFLDRSVVEICANGRACLTSRIYPSLPDSLGVHLFAHGGSANLASLDVWEMGSIWVARPPRPYQVPAR